MLHINGDRLWATLMELKEIGAYDDAATGLRGVKAWPCPTKMIKPAASSSPG